MVSRNEVASSSSDFKFFKFSAVKVLISKYVNDRKFENLNPLDDDANSFLHNVYCWKAYYLPDMNGWLVQQSVATARAYYVAKVGLFVLLATFLVLYRKTFIFPRFLNF